MTEEQKDAAFRLYMSKNKLSTKDVYAMNDKQLGLLNSEFNSFLARIKARNAIRELKSELRNVILPIVNFMSRILKRKGTK